MDSENNPSKLNELQLDLDELEALSATASRPLVKALLAEEVAKKSKQVKRLKELTSGGVKPQSQAGAVKIINYAWDQSDKFVKLFVTLNNVQSLPAESITTTFTTKSMELVVSGLENMNHTLRVTNLLKVIEPDKSYHKVKQDMVVVFMKKGNSTNWGSVSALDQKSHDLGLPKKPEENEDPSASLMNLMKKMYDEGDDEMKRSIAKAWYDAKGKEKTEPIL